MIEEGSTHIQDFELCLGEIGVGITSGFKKSEILKFCFYGCFARLYF